MRLLLSFDYFVGLMKTSLTIGKREVIGGVIEGSGKAKTGASTPRKRVVACNSF
jgi:hypothetical protein